MVDFTRRNFLKGAGAVAAGGSPLLKALGGAVPDTLAAAEPALQKAIEEQIMEQLAAAGSDPRARMRIILGAVDQLGIDKQISEYRHDQRMLRGDDPGPHMMDHNTELNLLSDHLDQYYIGDGIEDTAVPGQGESALAPELDQQMQDVNRVNSDIERAYNFGDIDIYSDHRAGDRERVQYKYSLPTKRFDREASEWVRRDIDEGFDARFNSLSNAPITIEEITAPENVARNQKTAADFLGKVMPIARGAKLAKTAGSALLKTLRGRGQAKKQEVVPQQTKQEPLQLEHNPGEVLEPIKPRQKQEVPINLNDDIPF